MVWREIGGIVRRASTLTKGWMANTVTVLSDVIVY